MVFSENGLIQKAQEAKDVQLIATYQDRIEIVCINWSLDKSLNDEIGIDNLWERMKDEGIILDIERDVEKLDDEGNYVITVPEGYKFQIHIDENGNAEVEYIGKDDALLPYIQSIEVVSKTTSSVNVEVTVTREGENLRLSYYYKKLDDPEENYIAIKENVADKTAEVTGLESETIYNLKVIAQNENGESPKVVELTVEGIIGADEGLREGAIIASEPTWDSNSHTASITLSKGADVASNLSIEWQINSIDTDGWTTGESVTGLNHNDTVYARLTDGTNHGQEGNITIKDGIEPTVQVIQGTVDSNTINVTVSAEDKEWGMSASPVYNYYIKPSSETNYPSEAGYTGTTTTNVFGNLTQNTSYDIKVTVEDKAGNMGTGSLTGIVTKTIDTPTGDLTSGAIIASNPTWSGGKASITLSKGSGVASNLSIQWQINSISGNWTTGESVTGLNHNDTVYARLTDGINHGQEASVTIKDGTAPSAPTISLSGTPGTNSYYKSNVTVTITAGSDGQSGANQVRYSVSGAQTVNQTTTAAGTTSASITISTNGTSTITAYTIDKAGNVSTAKTQVVYKDNTAPSTASLTVGTVGETSIAVTARGADATSGVYSYQFQRSTTSTTSGFTTVATQTSTATSYAYTYTGLTEGTTYYLRVIVTDRAGNTRTSSAVTQATESRTVANVLEEGDWVNYVDKNGDTRKCIVLYGPENANYASYGIQIITDDVLGTDMAIGNPTMFNAAIIGYNDAIESLNTRAEAYLNTDYASDARSVGSVPNNKNSQAGYHTTQFTSSYSGQLRDTDTNYEVDYNQMETLGIKATSEVYWLASRYVISNSTASNFNMRIMTTGGDVNNCSVFRVLSTGTVSSTQYAIRIRPIFTLKSGIKITGGSGTEDSPYTLGT